VSASEPRQAGRSGKTDRFAPPIVVPAGLAIAGLAVAALAALTPPGRRAVRRMARRLDSRVEGFSEPQARGYAVFAGRVLARLYGRVTDDVAAELARAERRAAERRAAERLAAERTGSGDGGPSLGGTRPAAILDIGCGPGDLAARLAERLPGARIVGLDLSPSMVELARSRNSSGTGPAFVVGEAGALPFESGTFDFVVSTLSLHHWPDAAAGFAEIGRVLAPRGVGLVYDLHLLTIEADRLPSIAGRAGFEPGRLRREPLLGDLFERLFVRFRVAGGAVEAATYVSSPAEPAGHARIPAAVTPGEVA
jgi:SAM-dependent methyltransferase